MTTKTGRKWTPVQRKKFMKALRARQRAKQQDLPVVEIPASDDQRMQLAHKLVELIHKLI